jgi:hypothetical protein
MSGIFAESRGAIFGRRLNLRGPHAFQTGRMKRTIDHDDDPSF